MNPATTPAPVACNTGDWSQKFSCGWHEPTTTAANAGAFAGHNVAPVLLGLLIVVILIALASKTRSSKPAASS